MGDQEIKYGLPPGEAYRDNELIGNASFVLETLRTVVGKIPITDIVHSGPAGGIPIRDEAYRRYGRKGDPSQTEAGLGAFRDYIKVTTEQRRQSSNWTCRRRRRRTSN
jgi:hypothetical protein